MASFCVLVVPSASCTVPMTLLPAGSARPSLTWRLPEASTLAFWLVVVPSLIATLLDDDDGLTLIEPSELTLILLAGVVGSATLTVLPAPPLLVTIKLPLPSTFSDCPTLEGFNAPTSAEPSAFI